MSHFDLDSEIKEVDNLISLAQRVCAVGSTDTIELFTNEVGKYMTEFDSWQSRIETSNPLEANSNLSNLERAEYQKRIKDLSEHHQEVISLSGQFREFLGSQLEDFHKRAQGIRRYAAPSKEPITLTGKRRG